MGNKSSVRRDCQPEVNESNVFEWQQANTKRKQEREEFDRKISQQLEEKKKQQEDFQSEEFKSVNLRKEQVKKLRMQTKQEALEMLKRLEEEDKLSAAVYKGAPIPINEDARWRLLLRYDILNTPKEENFDRITVLAAEMFGCKISLVSLVDKYQQWFKAAVGLEALQTCRNVAFCAYTIQQFDIMVVLDASNDERFKSNPLVLGPPYIRFYAAAPLTVLHNDEQFNLGTLCVIDDKPREDFSEKDRRSLAKLGSVTVRELEIHKRLTDTRQKEKFQTALNLFTQQAMHQWLTLKDIYTLGALLVAEELAVECVSIIDLKYCSFDTIDVAGASSSNPCSKAIASVGWDESEAQIVAAQELLQYGTKNGELVVVNDLTQLPLSPETMKYLSSFKLRCAMIATMHNNNHPQCIVSIYREEGEWTVLEVAFLNSFLETLQRLVERNDFVQQLELERRTSEELLQNMLPRRVSLALKAKQVKTEGCAATVLFTDIVGFTSLTEKLSAHQLVEMLNSYFVQLDRLVVKNGIEKVKTIGDSYMCAGGLLSHEEDHAVAVLRFALDALDMIYTSPDIQRFAPIAVRIGINSGPVVAGILGEMKHVYDIYGDAVNMAKRIESNGIPGKVQISEATHALIPKHLLGTEFKVIERGKIMVKGKSTPVKTYLVSRAQGENT